MEINLNNPIFVYYYKDTNYEIINEMSKNFNRITNITFWFVPGDANKFECLYDPRNNTKLIENISTILNDSVLSDLDFKSKIRNLIIEELSK